MTEVEHRGSYGSILRIFLLSRVASETISTFVWHSANYIWALCALVFIGIASSLILAMLVRREKNILAHYLPILAYLFFLMTRTDFGNLYSMKCFFSEVIVWFCFIFSVEICSRDPDAAKIVRTSVIQIVKFILLFGTGQLAIFLMRNGSLSPIGLVESRSVHGIFAHPNIFLVTMIPFLLYFTKQRSYLWIVLNLLTCLATGTRSGFVASLCIFIPVIKSVLKRPITRIDIGVSFVVLIIVYSVMISMNSQILEHANYRSRLNFASLEWRVNYWRNFSVRNHDFSSLLGHGVGSADLFGSPSTRPTDYPHNDYLRIYYDTGILGLILFLNLIFFVLRLLMGSTNVDNDFLLLTYMMVIGCCITDNFIYFTHSILVYMFIASFLSHHTCNPKKSKAKQPESDGYQ